MDKVDDAINQIVSGVGWLMDPVMDSLANVGAVIRQQLAWGGVSYGWQTFIITGLWIGLLFMILRTLGGWVRMIFAFIAMVAIIRGYHLVPGF